MSNEYQPMLAANVDHNVTGFQPQVPAQKSGQIGFVAPILVKVPAIAVRGSHLEAQVQGRDLGDQVRPVQDPAMEQVCETPQRRRAPATRVSRSPQEIVQCSLRSVYWRP